MSNNEHPAVSINGGSGGGGDVAAPLIVQGQDVLAMFIADTRDSSEYETCVQSMNQLINIALALGPARVRSQLLPFLLEFSDVENDEAQTAVARQLAVFPSLLGGNQYVHLLLPLLEKYCGEEEFVAVNSLNEIVPHLPKHDLLGKFVPILKRLANGDWFTTRVSASGLFSVCYPLVTELIQGELRSLFNNLCNDDTPMVRKAAFTALGEYATHLQKTYFRSDIFPIVKAISIDDMDGMRVHAISACVALGPVVDTSDFSTFFLPIIEAMQDDASWRVRAALAKQFAKLTADSQRAKPTTDTQLALGRKIFALFSRLLKDKEAEVRTAACEQISGMFQALSHGSASVARDYLDLSYHSMEALTLDAVSGVKIALSTSLLSLCPLVGREYVLKWLLPLMTQLSRDEHDQVRYFALLNVESFVLVCGIQALLPLILPLLLESTKDPKWRVRYSCLSTCHTLASHMGSKQFDKRVLSHLIGSLSDHVYAVRQLACKQLAAIATVTTLHPPAVGASALQIEQNNVELGVFGLSWVAERMLPLAVVLFDKTTNYLHRMTVLLLIEEIAAAYALSLSSPNTLAPTSSYSSIQSHPHHQAIDDNIIYTHATTLLQDHQQHLLSHNHHIASLSSSASASSTRSSQQPPPHASSSASIVPTDNEFLELIDKHAAPIILQACVDDVPNVRVAAAKTLTVLAESCKTARFDRKPLLTRFQPALQKMCSDSDLDASFFAGVFLNCD